MYNWRSMTEEQREYVLNTRKTQKRPWHSLSHTDGGKVRFHITAACYEHRHYIGKSIDRIAGFEEKLLRGLETATGQIYAYVILPNHYHVLIETSNISETLKVIFKIHQITGYNWNREEDSKGRKIWFNALEHGIKSERHYWATINYIHNNPVKHGYVDKWQDWSFSSASDYIDEIGINEAERIWKEYDISRMGDWDI